MRRRFPQAFTLIELMIAVAIVAILAGLAVPFFQKMECRAKQTEAKDNLAALVALLESHTAENGRPLSFGAKTTTCPGTFFSYPVSGIDTVHFQPIGTSRYVYGYQVFATNPARYEAVAVGCNFFSTANDFWIQQGSDQGATHLFDRCH